MNRETRMLMSESTEERVFDNTSPESKKTFAEIEIEIKAKLKTGKYSKEKAKTAFSKKLDGPHAQDPDWHEQVKIRVAKWDAEVNAELIGEFDELEEKFRLKGISLSELAAMSENLRAQIKERAQIGFLQGHSTDQILEGLPLCEQKLPWAQKYVETLRMRVAPTLERKKDGKELMEKCKKVVEDVDKSYLKIKESTDTACETLGIAIENSEAVRARIAAQKMRASEYEGAEA